MREVQCDIAVIGNDSIGLCCGYALKKLGLKVEFIAIDDTPRHWLAPWVALHPRKGKLDWTAILPKPDPTMPLDPLQLCTSQSRLTLDPEERAHLADWLSATKAPSQDPKLLDYFKRKSPRPTSHQVPTLSQPASSKYARLFQASRGGSCQWPRLDAGRINLDFRAYPAKALLGLAGLSETSELPAFIEDDLESFLFGDFDRRFMANDLIRAIEMDLKQVATKTQLDGVTIASSLGAVTSVNLGSSVKIKAETYLFNCPREVYATLSGVSAGSEGMRPQSTIWTFKIDASGANWPKSGRALHSENDNSSVCYIQWQKIGKITQVELLTTEEADFTDVSQFAHGFFNASVKTEHISRSTGLPTLSEISEVKVATRWRNALYAGADLGPRYHFAAQCSVAEELLAAVSLYREAPLTLSTLPTCQ